MMALIDRSPADVRVQVTRGDDLPVHRWQVSPGVVSDAVAQVRVRPDRKSQLVLDLDAKAVPGGFEFGGVPLSVAPGSYFWDVEVVLDGVRWTIMSGRFVVSDDVSEVVP